MAWSPEEMCKIAAQTELKDGYYVNLGIGMPVEVCNFLPQGHNIILHSENGMLGLGPSPRADEVDPDIITAGKDTATILPHGSYFDSATSFAMVRGGHIDLTILGAMQVSEAGDIANWSIPGKMIKGMGGAMDLVAGAKRVVVLMHHVAKDGTPKIVKNCTFPLTGKKVVNRIITDYGIFDIVDEKLILVQKPASISIEQIQQSTEAQFVVGC
ncbi:MAG: scoB [Candidatus Midichloriaceae bacterium]|jgi:3-oxoacid CoA-transferase subunit B|nr:scoB [Candidatus Midichloriaceae bacterium]